MCSHFWCFLVSRMNLNESFLFLFFFFLRKLLVNSDETSNHPWILRHFRWTGNASSLDMVRDQSSTTLRTWRSHFNQWAQAFLGPPSPCAENATELTQNGSRWTVEQNRHPSLWRSSFLWTKTVPGFVRETAVALRPPCRRILLQVCSMSQWVRKNRG